MMWFAPPKEKPIKVLVDMYRLHVIVYIGWSLDEIMADGIEGGVEPHRFTDKWKRWMTEAIEGAQGLCANFGHENSDVVIWLKDRPRGAASYGTLWHELQHAIDKISNGADPHAHFFADDWSSEPRAYLYEFLAVKITQDLWNRE